MYEVEIKVPAAHETVRERLRAAGAELTEHRRQRDIYYDAPHRTFAETDEALRIRHERVQGVDPDERETERSEHDGARDAPHERSDPYRPADWGDTARLTYKGPLLDAASKTRSEHETAVDDADALADILDGLGFDPAATVEKERAYWSLDGFTVTLDAVEKLGEFVEIEREVDDANEIDAVRDAAVDVLDRLGLDADEQVRTSYLGLLLATE